MSDMTPEEILTQQKANCIFCKIIAGEIPSMKVYENDNFVGIMDIRPATKGHVLLMPKEHYPILPIIPSDVAQEMFVVAKKLVKAVEDASLTRNASLFIANGAVAGQQSPHFLMHVIPRESGDGLPLENITVNASPEEANKVKMSLQARFKSSPSKTSSPAEVSTGDPIDDLANALEANPDVKKLIIKDPEKFKNYVKANPQLEALFKNIDIDKLSERLKQIDREKPVEQKKDEVPEEKNIVVDSKEKNEDSIPESEKKSASESISKTDGGADLDKISKLF